MRDRRWGRKHWRPALGRLGAAGGGAREPAAMCWDSRPGRTWAGGAAVHRERQGSIVMSQCEVRECAAAVSEVIPDGHSLAAAAAADEGCAASCRVDAREPSSAASPGPPAAAPLSAR